MDRLQMTKCVTYFQANLPEAFCVQALCLIVMGKYYKPIPRLFYIWPLDDIILPAPIFHL